MVLTLALLEVGSLFLVALGLLFVWAQPVLNNWPDLAIVIAQSLVFTVCCVLCFYYNDLYNLRIVRRPQPASAGWQRPLRRVPVTRSQLLGGAGALP